METMAARGGFTARLPVWRRLGFRLGASFLALTALAVLLSGLLQYRAEAQSLRQSLGTLLLNIARTGALLVDGDTHETVVATGRGDSPQYAAIRERLRLIQESNQLADAVYTLTRPEGARSRFAVISNAVVPVGTEYPLVPVLQDALRRVFDEGVSAYTDVYTNHDGTWITAFAPVRNTRGQVVAALDVDYRVDVYLARLAQVRRRLYLHALAGALLALVAGVVIARRVTRPVGQLARLAHQVVEGDLTARVRIASRDEIGLLGNVFHLMVERLQVSHRSLVDVLVRALEAREDAPGGLRRVARAASAVGERLQLTPAQAEALELGALLHDIGEIRVPESVLRKTGALTPDERRLVEGHPAAGVEILEAVPLLTPALDVIGSHHERYDGAGYPAGLRDDGIPLTARIFAVVDALEAMTHDRPYRRGRPLAEALAVLREEAGKQFDPRVVEAALGIPPLRWAELLEVTASP
jgi:HD-GYP domain-containing protein (c-di-GMP phosphodiesterase class II)